MCASETDEDDLAEMLKLVETVRDGILDIADNPAHGDQAAIDRMVSALEELQRKLRAAADREP